MRHYKFYIPIFSTSVIVSIRQYLIDFETSAKLRLREQIKWILYVMVKNIRRFVSGARFLFKDFPLTDRDSIRFHGIQITKQKN